MGIKRTFLALSILVLFLVKPKPAAATYTLIQQFGVLSNVTGFQPQSRLVQDASGYFYGTASSAEGSISGTVYRIRPNGTGFQVLMRFAPLLNLTNATGANPYGGLILSGSNLFGTTYNGGTGGSGTIFYLHTDGSGFTVLTNLPPAPNLTNSLGAHPYGGLLQSGPTLFGTAQAGGANGNGTIFSIGTNGSGFAVLKTFSADPLLSNSDGAAPDGTLGLAGGIIYGTTVEGGAYGYGTIFSLNAGNLVYTVLHSFTDGTDGANPNSGVSYINGWLYGTAAGGGSGSGGTIFAIKTDGTSYSAIYSFTNGVDGASPDGGVLLAGNTLYGTTYGTTFANGQTGFGTVFSVTTNGTGFTNLYSFDGGSNGGYPLAGLTLFSSALYGSTSGVNGQTDQAGGNGTVFSISTNGGAPTNLLNFAYSDAANPRGTLAVVGNTFFGTTYFGGSNGLGTVFKINADGSGYSVVKSFSMLSYNTNTLLSTNTDGTSPAVGLVLARSNLYGVTLYGGYYDSGTIFSIDTNGANFHALYQFTGSSDGAQPQGTLAYFNGVLYGTAANGGSSGNGTVFSINLDGSGFTVLKTFSPLVNGANQDGANPLAGLMINGIGLFGTAYAGGPSGLGTVFSLPISGGTFTTLYGFTGASDGANPDGNLIVSGTHLYGTAYYGGSNNNGTIYSLNSDGSQFSVLNNFAASAISTVTGLSTNLDGANPNSDMVLNNGVLYGTAVNGGVNGYGTVFAVNTAGTGDSVLYSFSNTDGANAYAGLLLYNNALYGATLAGGSVGDGLIYSLSLGSPGMPLAIQLAGTNVILSWSGLGAVLQSSSTLNGIYTNVTGGIASPVTNALSGSQLFFRLATSP